MAIRTIIPGPPGTGKTYRLLNHYMKKEIKDGTDPQQIIYITFSKAAALEAQERIEELFPEADIKYVSTMHAMGLKESKINTQEYLLDGKYKWQDFKNLFPMWRTLNTNQYKDPDTGQITPEDPLLAVRQYAIAKKISLEESAIQKNYIGWDKIDLCHQLNEDLNSYKEKTHMIEFHDMIIKFTNKLRLDPDCFSADVVFLDEAQDLNPLQWDMYFEIEKICKRSYIAGDDDQTIYNFQGAEPDIFINLKGIVDEQVKSRRVPREVHSVATSILQRINQRREKKWEARDEEGMVLRNVDLEELDFETGNWMILARTNKLAMTASEHLYSRGIRYFSKTSEHLPKAILIAYQTWVRLNQGASVRPSDATKMYNYLKVKKGHIDRGFSSGKSFSHLNSVDLDELKDNHGLRVAGSWEQLDFPQNVKDYIKVLIERGDNLLEKSRIEVTTIHQSKGRECQNVVLFCDFGHESAAKFLYEAYETKPDETHRVFFVGTTRAKQNLFILEPTTEYAYQI